jgi:hypothetical protein
MGAGDADVTLSVKAKSDGSIKAAIAEAETALKSLEATVDKSSTAESADVAVLRAQYEAAAKAVAGVEAAIDAARAAGAPVSADAAQRLRETSQQVADLRKQLSGIPDAVEPINPALEEAEQAARNFSASVEKGGRGAERQLGRVGVAIDDLEEEIRRLRGAGQPVADLEARLARLRSEAVRDTLQLGRLRAATRDAGDAMKVATIRAGEFEGQLGSLEAILSIASPGLGGFASKLVAIVGAIELVLLVGKQAKEVIDKIGKAAGEAYARQLEQAIEESDRLSGASVRLAENLRNVLSKEGYDIAADSLADLLVKDAEFQRRLIERRSESDELAKAITGDAKALRDSTQSVLAGIREVQEGRNLTAQQAKLALAALDQEIGGYERLGKAAPAALTEARKSFVLLARTEADAHAEHERFLTDFGVRTQNDFFESAKKIRDFNLEAQISGEVTPAAALKIIAAVDEIRAAQKLLPEDQRIATAGVLASLEEMQEGYRETASVALAAFGVQTPDAVRRSAEAVSALAAAYGPLGEINKEQAEKIKAEALKILESIALLPKAQQAAVADVTGSLVKLVTEYGTAAAKQREFALDVEAFEKESLERRKAAIASFSETLGSGLSALIQQLRDVDAASKGVGSTDTSALRDELSGLEKAADQGPISQDQQNRINEIRDALIEAGDGAARFAGGLEDAADEGGRVVATSAQVDAVLREVIGSLQGNAEGWRELGIEQRVALETLLGNLQQAGVEGGATAEVLESSLAGVRNVLQGAGLDTATLDQALGDLSSGTVNLGRAFSDLDNKISANEKAFNDFTGKAVDGSKKTTLGVNDIQKSAKGAAEKIHELGTTTKQAGDIMLAALQPAAETLDSIAAKIQKAIGLAQQLGQVPL